MFQIGYYGVGICQFFLKKQYIADIEIHFTHPIVEAAFHGYKKGTVGS